MQADPHTLIFLGGALACVLAILWRGLARHHQTSKLLDQLERSVVPEERARAGQTFIDLGLPRAANPILHAMDREPDDRVRLSVALAVARRQWEPTRPARVGRLRRWASEELDFQGHPVSSFGPATTRLADMGGPRLPENNRAPAPTDDHDPNGNEHPVPTNNGNGTAHPSSSWGRNGNGNGTGSFSAPEMVAPPPGPLAPESPHAVMARPVEVEPTPDPGGGIHWSAPRSPSPPQP